MRLLLLLIWATPCFSLASTFIGNGGNAGDIEREVTLRQVLGAFKAVEAGDIEPENLCSCSGPYKSRPVCDSLESLNEAQRGFCVQTFRSSAKKVMRLLESDRVKFSWTENSIQVREGQSLRNVDAVADPSKMKITINQERFLKMSDTDRVFLLGHEVMHLIKYKGNYLDDEGPIGPFKGPDGKRLLLNSIGSSVVMASYKQELFKKYKTVLKKPKTWKKHRIEAGLSTMSLAGSDSDSSAFASESLSGGQFVYRYQTSSPWGFLVSFRSLRESQKVLTSIEVEEELSGAGIGVSYRVFPFSDPLSFWGQSLLLIEGLAEFYQGRLKVSDPLVGIEDETSAPGASLDCKYYIPLNINIWLYAGAGVQYLNYEYDDIGPKYESIRTHATIGASYGF